MSAEYDDFEESLLRAARRRSSPAGAKARAFDALLAASASASLVVALGRYLVTIKLWVKSGAGLSTVVAMVGGSALLAAIAQGSTSVERLRVEEAPRESLAAPSFAAPPEPTKLGSLVESASINEAPHIDALPATPIPTTVPSAPSAGPRNAPARSAPPRTPAADAPTQAANATTAAAAAAETSAPAGELGQLGRENALIQTAQSALRRGDTQSAFEALDQHGRHFGASGALASEAEVLRIEALARTGRRAEAEARARVLITSQPRSSLVRRVLAILGRDGESR